jgi:hypothetical protein
VSESKPRGNPWPKGVSGNPKGRPKKGESFSDIIREYYEITDPDLKTTYRRAIVWKQLQKAILEGDTSAAKWLKELGEGKTPQPITFPHGLDELTPELEDMIERIKHEPDGDPQELQANDRPRRKARQAKRTTPKARKDGPVLPTRKPARKK